MLKPLNQIGETLRNNEAIHTMSRIMSYLYTVGFPFCFVFVLYDHFTSHDRRDITILIRGTKPESDTFALLNELAVDDTERALYAFSPQGIDDTQLTHWDDSDVTTESAELHTLTFFRALAQSEIVLCKSNQFLKWYRLLDRSDRRYVRLYHGPITKAYGSTRTGSEPSSFGDGVPLPDTAPRYRSVASVGEKYFRASAEGCHPSQYPTWGYPRFDRIQRFIGGDASPVLPENAEAVLEEGDYTDILYAPTHKDGAYTTTFLPFEDADTGRLRDWCHEHDVRLFLRPHPKENVEYDHLVDDERIFSADQTFANSATELMPYLDGLITDYSSIYVAFLLYDRPVIFLKDDHERFLSVRGLAFDYERYFPGPKPETFDAFLDELATITDGHDEFANERSFVRDTFVPGRETTFLEAILDECNS
ncbi:CDP-glycerol glycerophosphotransferase family protein [Haloarcula nitratireducens]|uniref:CDP-glycerol glycerophosphotransferase family protein n=1 Tax=Haloarcula nitratireducens TaxID=2487749 RepID=A0AAW4PH24_9EURY|nr:CDP-glycerol glycerophosphotransferase family protein [Halomicroarcula nitratireducens]MBX0297756.1 CDP-glycerol glycerophosphotransferase family protein [Halomicroarcula nitratireducens]